MDTKNNVALEDMPENSPEVPAEDNAEEDVGIVSAEEQTAPEDTAETSEETADAGSEETALVPSNCETLPAETEKYDEAGEYEDGEEYYEEERDIPKKAKKKRRKKGGGSVIFGVVLSVVIISVSILAAVFILKSAKEIVGLGRADVEIVVDIPMNSSTEDIANQLFGEGIIEDVNLFRLFSRFKKADGTYIAGTHKLSQNMDYNSIIETLQEEAENQRETADIVFQEGITVYAAAQKLEEKGICNADEFIEVFNSSSFGFDFEENVKVSSMKFYKMEGYLFPDTYQFYLEEDPRVVAKKIYKNFEARVTPDLRGRMSDLDMEMEEVLTLASIVQAEAANTRDMKNVASVFYNRLNAPDEFPLLQSDPTTNYVEDIIMPNIEVRSEKMFEAYDTYRGAGLPPGPICNPGLDAINAVLYPAETDYFYFCSNLETGEFYYAETLEQHEQNCYEAGLTDY